MHVVAIGGGHGLSRTLLGLKAVADEVTAVVTVADDGGSSGRLRRDLGVAPPGDLRMALWALANNRQLADLLQYRWDRGELIGHALGNLIIVAMADLYGADLVTALDRLGAELDIRGAVLPCTTTPLVLHASRDGLHVTGQVQIAKGGTPERIWIEPERPTPTPRALAAIADADLVVLGPGSLYTSILPNLLVPEVAEALHDSSAPLVLVGNIREQPGETEGMTLAEHVDAIAEHVPGLRLDAVVAHAGPAPTGPGRRLDPTPLHDHPLVGHVSVADLLDGEDGHDPARLGTALLALLDGLTPRTTEPGATG